MFQQLSALFLLFFCVSVSGKSINGVTVSADKAAQDEAKFLKWSRDLNAHFKAGFPNYKNISSIDPYVGKYDVSVYYVQPVGGVISVVSVASALGLGTYKNAELSFELTDFYKINGLGDRQVLNCSATSLTPALTRVFLHNAGSATYNRDTTSVKCYVSYNEITVEGKYTISHKSSNPVIAKVTGDFKYILTGKTFVEYSVFNGTQGQSTKYEFLVQFLDHPNCTDSWNPIFYKGNFTLSGVPTELEGFVKTEHSVRAVESIAHHLIFGNEEIGITRQEICRHSWDNNA